MKDIGQCKTIDDFLLYYSDFSQDELKEEYKILQIAIGHMIFNDGVLPRLAVVQELLDE